MAFIFKKLTKIEENLIGVFSVTTITFFEGSIDTAKAELTSKLYDMVSFNPWLMGSLHKKDSSLQLKQSQVITESDIQKIINPFNPKEPEPKLNSKMTQFELCSSITNSPAEIPPGRNLIDNNKPLVALSIIKDSLLENRFAVIFSVCHIIVDGQTFHNLLSMLSENGTPSSMNFKKKDDKAQQEDILIGKEEMEIMRGGSIICNVISTLLFKSKPKITSYVINTDKVEKEKSKKDGVEFLSTNDILSSTFGNVTKARLLMLLFNMRGKVEHFKNSDAGYQVSNLLLTQHDYETPSLIRKTLNTKNPKYIRATNTPLPTGCEMCGCKLAAITNWTFDDVFTQLDIKDCSHVAHMPNLNVNLIFYDIAIIQRPQKGKLAVAFFARNLKDEDLVKEMPLNQQPVANADDLRAQLAEK